MKQQNRVFIDIICQMKEMFVPFLMHLLCTFSVIYFEPFLREECFFQVQMKCLGQAPTILRKWKLIGKALLS